MLVGRRVVIGLHLPPICLTPELLCLLILLVDVLNIRLGFWTLKAVYP
jgi:hypothetical protein